MPKRASKASLAKEAWQRLFHFFISTRAQRDRVLGRHGLTPNDVRTLTSLNSKQGRTMRSLAQQWGCDASNATWIVDRLERRGLAKRTPHATDRRVKHVVLTAAGDRLRRKVLRDLDQPPPEFVALDIERLTAILDALEGIENR